MLVEFSLQNHRSFREKQTFKMTASNAKDEHAAATGNNAAPYVLREACLFGANGSGKSALIDGMRLVQNLVKNSFKESDALKAYTPHLFHSDWRTAPAEFEVAFITEGSLFQYGFAIDSERVWDEWLFERPNATQKQRQIFTREYDAKTKKYIWETSTTYLKGERESWKAQTRDNALFMSTAVQLNSESLQVPFDWLTDSFQTIRDVSNLSPYTASRLDDADWKARVLAFLNDIDLHLADVSSEEKDFLESPEFRGLSSETQSQLKSVMPDGAKVLEVSTFREDNTGRLHALNLRQESTGTQELFDLVGPVFDVLDQGKTLAVDEMNTRLHPLAFRYITQLFCDPKTNPKEAQLIFTSHDVTVTEQDCIGRDQIWLVKKGDDLASILEPFSDWKTRDERPFRKGYLQGRYGAVPRLAS